MLAFLSLLVLLSGMGVGSEPPKKTRSRIDPKDRGPRSTGVKLIAWRGDKAYKAWAGSGATGSHQVLPGGLVELPPKRVGEPRNAEFTDVDEAA